MSRSNVEHPLRLQSKVGFPQRIGGVLRMALPDHGLHIVLEKYALTGIFKIGGRHEKIANDAIEALGPNQLR